MNGKTLLEAMEKARRQADYSFRTAGTWSKDHPVQIKLLRKNQKRMRQWRKFRLGLLSKINPESPPQAPGTPPGATSPRGQRRW